MSATANPNFDLQQQAIDSLRRIHQICLALEALQVLASMLVMSVGYLIAKLSLSVGYHLYAAMMYFFVAIFAHAVVYYVLLAIGNNVRSVYYSNPNTVDEWLVIATGKLRNRILPFVITHGVVLIVMVVSALISGGIHNKPFLHQILAWVATVNGVACLVSIYSTLRVNTRYLTSFVRTGGFRDAETPGIDDV